MTIPSPNNYAAPLKSGAARVEADMEIRQIHFAAARKRCDKAKGLQILRRV